MIQKHRIATNIGVDQKVIVELKQNYDLLEILSLKFSQKQTYTSLCSDYGVVCGRISVNNGFGIPNARVSIFIPLSDMDENDPVVSALYPYKSPTEKNDNGLRYNLLPERKQHGGHEPVGSFFDQSDVLNNESKLEVFEKYYSYTVKTNDAGDFMIWGVPIGPQILHVDIDLSDISCFSLRPDDFIRQGIGVDQFKNTYTFKSSTDLSTLPQIVSFDKSIEVFSFWGNVDLCEIGITRTDFDLSDEGVKVEPKAYLLGSVFSDQGNNSVNKNCTPKNTMGYKCNLTSDPAVIEVLRFTSKKDINNRPILELYEINEDVDDSGSFVLTLPMNMDYVYTNEFGENEITNDPNKGIPTSGCYRFRISTKNESVGRVRTTASYLVPNIREFENEIDKSYAWSTDWSDYPIGATNNSIIFYSENGRYYPKDYFYRLTYNKVYSVSSFMGSYFSSSGGGRDTFLGIKEISPKKEDDCEENVVTPPINFGIEKFTFAILIATILNIFERLIYYAFIAAVQILIIPFQALYNFRIRIRAFRVTIIDWRPFEFLDRAVIEPLQRFGTVRLGIAIYPDCETCDNLDYVNELPNTNEDPALLFTEIASGTAIPDNYMVTYGCAGYTDDDPSLTRLYFVIPGGTCSPASDVEPTFLASYNLTMLINEPSRFVVKFNNSQLYDTLVLNQEIINGITTHYFDDYVKCSYTNNRLNEPTEPITYKIYDKNSLLLGGSGGSGLQSELQGGCQQYVSVYRENIVSHSYCVVDPSISYNSLTTSNLVLGSSCPPDKINVGQVIRNVDANPCGTCGTKSGYSEFRFGLFTIIPAASTRNWGVNFDAITEYAIRKLVAKLFCEGYVNYSFIDNWLTGALYIFPFKSKVRWDNEEELDLNYRRTKYCDNLVYYKVGTINNPDKRFYYRSTKYISGKFNRSIKNTLGHPTTIVDLGPRDEFIKEICVDASVDPNCSIVRSIGPTSYQNFKELLGLYINYKLDYLGPDGGIKSFFKNNGFNTILPNKLDGRVLNGDILQLISINNETGIEEFDLQNRNYAVYSPQILDVESYPTLLDGGPMPINFVLDGTSNVTGSVFDGEGFRVRACLNEIGRLTEASQDVPFFLWDKGGDGFGSGTNHHWDYNNIEVQPLQGMTKEYKYTGDSTHKYILFPMTKLYSGNTFTYPSIQFNDIIADVVSTSAVHTNYDMQEEGFSVLECDDEDNPTTGNLYIRTGDTANWATISWTNTTDFLIKPTTTNYNGNQQILSTPFLFYFGLRPGKTAVDKFMERFGPKGAFKSAE